VWVLALVAAILQATFLAGWQPWGVVPDLLFIVLIRTSNMASLWATLVAALVGGLVLDLAAGGQFGLEVTFAVVLVLALAWLRRSGVVMGFALELAAVAVSGGLFGLLQIVVANGGWVALGALAGRLASTVVLDVVLAAILYRPLTGLLGLVIGGSEGMVHESA